MFEMYRFSGFFLKFKPSMLLKITFFFLNAAISHALQRRFFLE
jgi:hypothetical protein